VSSRSQTTDPAGLVVAVELLEDVDDVVVVGAGVGVVVVGVVVVGVSVVPLGGARVAKTEQTKVGLDKVMSQFPVRKLLLHVIRMAA
jgi:hypothetical protein